MVTEFGEHQIKLTKWVESNTNFIHYHFIYVEQEKSRKQPDDPTDDFQDLWNDL